MTAPTIRVEQGDMLDVLAKLAAEGVVVQSIVTDPPYHLQSIVKRFGNTSKTDDTDTSARARAGADGYARLSTGFMGKTWDGGDIAFRPETWRLCYDLLPPGGHLLAFAGTRTYHRIACAIEDAGFEIRDMLAWLYGSGFPKSHNVGKAIDKRRNWSALPRLQAAIRQARNGRNWSQSEAARRCGLIGPHESLGGGGYIWFETGMRIPTRALWPALRDALGLGAEFDDCFTEAEREITGAVEQWTERANYEITSKDGFRRDLPATPEAAAWQGWGTALKPALEPLCIARKPLAGTVAGNVLAHGTGALNIDACRVGTESTTRTNNAGTNGDGWRMGKSANVNGSTSGRWPANVAHDGSDDVVEAFPDRASCNSPSLAKARGAILQGERSQGAIYPGENGNASRFFYSAKADEGDRLASKHPTVKPVDLIRWLVRLVTPPGGTVLDPFAGSGTTAMACMAEGFDCIVVEREAEYAADIRRRIAHVHGLDTPLFGGGK
jgi:DNA modification methylase/transcriptional regulator with XRE-family HTH domain